jgi:hypothetical protein
LRPELVSERTRIIPKAQSLRFLPSGDHDEVTKVKLDATPNHQECQKQDETDLSASSKSQSTEHKKRQADNHKGLSKSPTYL